QRATCAPMFLCRDQSYVRTIVRSIAVIEREDQTVDPIVDCSEDALANTQLVWSCGQIREHEKEPVHVLAHDSEQIERFHHECEAGSQRALVVFLQELLSLAKHREVSARHDVTWPSEALSVGLHIERFDGRIQLFAQARL